MSDFRFHVIVPIYNVEKYLAACLDSILAQTYTNYDAILVDDGSTDSCGAICEQYASQNPHFYVIHKPNGGLLSARIAGIERAKEISAPEDYLAFVDSDDIITPDFLEAFHRAIVRDGSDLAFCRFNDLHPDGSLTPSNPPQMPVGCLDNRRELYRIMFNDWGYIEMPRKAVSIQLFDDMDFSSFYSIRIGEDLLQSTALFRKCRKVSFLEETTYQYRENPTSLTNTQTFENYKPYFTILRYVWDAMEEEGVWQEEDYQYFLQNFCKINVRWSIWLIAKFMVPIKQKLPVYQQMCDDFIYSKVFDATAQTDWDMRMMQRRHFYPILLLGYLLGFLRIFYRQYKKFRLARYTKET